MALSAFTKAVANVKPRQGQMFVSDDAGVTYYHLGLIRDLKVKSTKVTTSPDTAGRKKQISNDISVDAILQQTADAELAVLDEIAGVELQYKVTEVLTNAAGAAAAAGIVFKNALAEVEPDLDFGGNESGIGIMFGGRVANSQLANFVSTGTVTFDA
jgi:hypothetical protein